MKGRTGMPADGNAVCPGQKKVSVSPGSRRGFPGEPFGKRSSWCDSAAGKPQNVRSAAASGASWVMPETVKRRPYPSAERTLTGIAIGMFSVGTMKAKRAASSAPAVDAVDRRGAEQVVGIAFVVGADGDQPGLGVGGALVEREVDRALHWVGGRSGCRTPPVGSSKVMSLATSGSPALRSLKLVWRSGGRPPRSTTRSFRIRRSPGLGRAPQARPRRQGRSGGEHEEAVACRCTPAFDGA